MKNIYKTLVLSAFGCIATSAFAQEELNYMANVQREQIRSYQVQESVQQGPATQGQTGQASQTGQTQSETTESEMNPETNNETRKKDELGGDVELNPTTQSGSISKYPVQPVQKPATQQPANQPKQTATEDESVLSFNFLYMIIQKFKISEILE